MNVRTLRQYWKPALLTGVLVLLSSAVRLNVVVAGFRISPAVIFYPVLIMTLGLRVPVLLTALLTAMTVFSGRLAMEIIEDSAAADALSVLPGALFYLFYGLLFGALVRDRKRVRLNVLFIVTAVCDFVSNIAEVLLRVALGHAALPKIEVYFQLASIALMRSVVAVVLVFLVRLYHTYLSREEHENRYRRLLLLTSSLKNETYLMRKNSNKIEAVMKDAYSLYEDLAGSDIPEDLRKRSLRITSEVHDIKKDYLRIIQGIEKEIDLEISEESFDGGLPLSDILSILVETEEAVCMEKGLNILFRTEGNDRIQIRAHVALMSVLHNLVNNAVEAVAAEKKEGTVTIRERIDGERLLVSVTDDGPGIAEKHLPRIFDMGFSTKFDPETGNIFRGVGLSGVKEIVETQMHGTIRVESGTDSGTTFTLDLPLEAQMKEA
ncbi:MAG: ATP-binding protein [Lachnospiraceae bacterium]|nr:ATP-binding protein [Lachnospiraceae bacterium]